MIYKEFFSVFVFVLVISMGLVMAQYGADSIEQENQLTVSTANAGAQVQTGVKINSKGEEISVQSQGNNEIQLEAQGISAKFNGEMTEVSEGNKTKLYARMSNGSDREVKIMPDTASETALEKLRLRNCVAEEGCLIELKEVGNGDDTRLAYEIQIERHSRILGIFQKKMQIRTQVDAENGEIIDVNKPWWAFIATEPAEE
ncbi:MAG: hypothetical protein QT05_C0045G0002 [archaeon GW2011_AR13]|nr:MAG: hypothetical protein QT05_C0045G0002 [archaeon GW2011_AR13]HIH63245.1 hypothetical protein [Nanoarchaeota archaeon]HIJ09240.1 hypothetical protein [Nanoarchaeota archaeon]